MIYASLKPVRAWRNPWTVADLPDARPLQRALLTAVLLFGYGLGAVHRCPDRHHGIAGAALKLGYWRFLDHGSAASTAETATVSAPSARSGCSIRRHGIEYLLKEMGYRVARKHSARLRLIVLVLGFAVPVALSLLTAFGGVAPLFLSLLAALAGGSAVVVERWLFFAEARHNRHPLLWRVPRREAIVTDQPRHPRTFSGLLGRAASRLACARLAPARERSMAGLGSDCAGGMVPAAVVARELDIRLIDTSASPATTTASQGKLNVLKRADGDGEGWR